MRRDLWWRFCLLWRVIGMQTDRGPGRPFVERWFYTRTFMERVVR